MAQGFTGIGIPNSYKYETSIKSDKFLLLVHGSADELVKARSILKSTGTNDIMFILQMR